MMLARHKKRNLQSPELNITAFLNLMVVLIPFLLLSAAFSQLSVLELYLPINTDALDILDKNKKIPQFEVILLADKLIINEKQTATIATLKNLSSGLPNITDLQNALVKLKSRYPEIKKIYILSGDNILYDELIHIMDSVRAIRVDVNGRYSMRELFPDIALGEIPDSMVK